jgi:tetratricopeptide (TPR) repeat protein
MVVLGRAYERVDEN